MFKVEKTRPRKASDSSKLLTTISLIIIFIKIIIIQNISVGIWPGADAENYLSGLIGLNQEGFFSSAEKLIYWPAGYPIFIYLLSLVTESYFLPLLAMIQSIFFSLATLMLCKELLNSRLKNYSFLAFILISLNPTLSLSSLTIGYESFAASGILLSLAIITKDLNQKEDKFSNNLILVSIVFGCLSFFQPRLILIGIFFISIWVYIRRIHRKSLTIVLVAFLILLLIPSTLIFRNYKAVGIATISTNLGNTMMLGVGNGASGGYLSPLGSGVPCKTSGNQSEVDKQLIFCAAHWYLENPRKSAELVFKKSLYFWSPWYGPTFNGTMARNPWLKINPIRNMTATIDGAKLVFGGLGKAIAYMWEIFSILLLFYGARTLWKLGNLERTLGILAGGTIFIAMATTWLTLGDNRFRLPIMGMSLFLQAVGIRTLLKGGKPPMVDGPGLR